MDFMQRSNAMKKRLILALVLGAVLVLVLAWSASALSGRAPSGPEGPDSASNPLTLNVSLPGDPPTLDPALTTDTSSTTMIRQLFGSLLQIDDETGEARPSLATDWGVSADGKVYSFTLRTDALWSDGRRITPDDVRYGILRALTPGLSTAAQLYYPIFNAEAFHSGAITDPDQVGVRVLDASHLEIRLGNPSASALYMFGRIWPMPKWTIDAWGSAWTDPTHIVTSGPYRLTEWVHGEHLILDKYWQFYAEDQVQIERIKVWIVSDSEAWDMYVAGQLDTASVPGSATLDDELRKQLHRYAMACTYYYGFSVTQPPFDDPLVRRAFAAATDRVGLLAALKRGPSGEALTFTPPGIFGHVDGRAEGVGIPYNETLAQQWLSDAGYPGGAGLPQIKLWYNDAGSGHQYIANYVATRWHDILGADVVLQSLPWAEYIVQVDSGNWQAWRLSWCMDYPGAYNFLHDGVQSNAHGGWHNASYEDLLDQTLTEADPDVRKGLYKQAEEILVESDAVMIPLYYMEGLAAAKPYLQRSYPVSGEPDYSKWRIRTSETIEPDAGGTVTSYLEDTVIEIPPNAIEDSVIITVSSISRVKSGGPLTGIGHLFEVTAVITPTGEPAVLAPDQTYNLTVHYTDAERGPVKENTLALYSWDGDEWVKEPTSVVEGSANTVSATPNHFSLWTVLGETNRTFLPLVLRF
jgi:oligopeptide transport system substrate-binding protein